MTIAILTGRRKPIVYLNKYAPVESKETSGEVFWFSGGIHILQSSVSGINASGNRECCCDY